MDLPKNLKSLVDSKKNEGGNINKRRKNRGKKEYRRKEDIVAEKYQTMKPQENKLTQK